MKPFLYFAMDIFLCFELFLLFASHKAKAFVKSLDIVFNYVNYMHSLLTGKTYINMFIIPVHFSFSSVFLYAVIACMYTYLSWETIAKIYWKFFHMKCILNFNAFFQGHCTLFHTEPLLQKHGYIFV